jgi:nitrogen fixation protein FixH
MSPPVSSKSSNKPRSRWHLFPYAIIAALFLVIAVNVAMIYAAEVTFTGEVHHPYE